MGSDYSRIQGSTFPVSYFVLGFRQPDVVQLLNAPHNILNCIRQILNHFWSPGIKSEKKYTLGIEIRLHQEPFGSDINNVERMIATYKLCNQLLQSLMNEGFEILTSGHLLRGIERSAWIFRTPHEKKQSDTELITIGMEDWGKMIFVNSFSALNEEISKSVKQIWSKGIENEKEEPTLFYFDLMDQPWDSYKSSSEKTPYIILELFRILSNFGYSYLTSTHIRANTDAITFRKVGEPVNNNSLSILSLNQRDQVRLYAAPASVVRATCKLARDSWEHGVIKEEQWGGIAVTQLKGSPWFIPDWDKDSITSAREFVTELIKEVRSQGWNVVAKADIYRSAYDKSLLILQEGESSSVWPHLSFSSHDVDRLTITGTTETLKKAIIDEIRNSWSRGFKEESLQTESGWTIEFTLEGRPWIWDIESPAVNLEAVGLICTIIDFLLGQGWRLVTGMEISSNTKFTPSTWIFSYEEDYESRPVIIKDN